MTAAAWARGAKVSASHKWGVQLAAEAHGQQPAVLAATQHPGPGDLAAFTHRLLCPLQTLLTSRTLVGSQPRTTRGSVFLCTYFFEGLA